MKKYKRVGICTGYLIYSFAQIPELFYLLVMGGLCEARVSSSHLCHDRRYYAANQNKITPSNVNAFSVYCTVNHLLQANFFLNANMVLA